MALITKTTRDADNARAYGDEGTDVWLGQNRLGQELTLPRVSSELRTFASAHAPLGWLNEDGVPIDTDTDTQDFYALQGSQLILSKITQTTRTLTVQALEEVARVTELWWGHDAPKAVGNGESLVDLPASLKTIDCWCIAHFEHGEYFKTYVFPHVLISDRGTLDHSNSDLSMYEMTLKIRGNGWMFTNNPDYFKTAAGKENFDAKFTAPAVAEVTGVDVTDLQAKGSRHGG